MLKVSLWQRKIFCHTDKIQRTFIAAAVLLELGEIILQVITKEKKKVKGEIETNILYSREVSTGQEGGLRPAFIVFWLWLQGSH